jgi:hypothetical protein
MNAGADDNPDSGEPAEADDFTEDDDGEDGEADDFEVTESDREKDRNLAIQFATAALTGAATLAGVVPGALATMFAPIAAAIMTAAVQRLGRRRAEHAADTLLDAADAAGVPLGEFMDKAVADDRRHELFARTMRVARTPRDETSGAPSVAPWRLVSWAMTHGSMKSCCSFALSTTSTRCIFAYSVASWMVGD